MHTRGMLQQAINPPEDDSPLEERIQEEVRVAFDTTDSIHEEVMEVNVGDEAEEEEPRDDQHPPHVVPIPDGGDPHFDATLMDESLHLLYNGS